MPYFRAHLSARWAIALAAALLWSSPAAAVPRLVFLGLRAGSGVSRSVAQSVSQYAQTELSALGVYTVVGLDDINSLLGLEQRKELLGCKDNGSCVAELAGALGVDRALSGELSRIGNSVLVSMTLLDVGRARVIARVGQRVEAAGSLEPVLDTVKPLLTQLALADGRPVAPGLVSALEWVALARGELDLRAGAGALSAGVLAQGSLLGAQALLVGPTRGSLPVGLRLEARLSPKLGKSALRPYLTAGAAIFSSGVALRGSIGAEVRIRRWRVFADLGLEHYFSADLLDGVLLAAGAGYAF